MDHSLSEFSNLQTGLLVSCLMETNEYTKPFGVVLTKEDAAELVLSRNESLKTEGRIEFGESILPKIIREFCDSPNIYQDNYKETIEELVSIFYLYKNESMDELTDDELIQYMKLHFDGDCQGSLDFLEETCLESFAREIRANSYDYLKEYAKKLVPYEEETNE